MSEKRLIDADAFIEDIKTENMNLYLDGMKGTPRPRSELYDIIDRINEQPTVDAVEIPCKIGDRVWAIRNFKGVKHAESGIVNDMLFTKEMKLQIVVKYVARGEWGKVVFATKEEAEAAIVKTAHKNPCKFV